MSTRQNARRLAVISARQDQTVGAGQLRECGYDRYAIRRRVRAGRWQIAGRAVVLHNAELTQRNLKWSAVLSVKGPAAVCVRTAPAGYRLLGFESIEVEVLIGAKERVPEIEGVRWRRHRRFSTADISPGPRPAAVRPARAVIDAASWTDEPRVACALMIAAVQQQVTKVAALREALDAAGQIRHRRHLTAVLVDIEGGVDSLSEKEFGTLARRAGLPPPKRQSVRLDAAGRRRYLDAAFGAFSVEIDGGFHLRPLNYWADTRRHNELVLGGDRILRFPSVAIRLEPEVVVAQLRAAGIAFGLITPPLQ
jgi:hypothetical protein